MGGSRASGAAHTFATRRKNKTKNISHFGFIYRFTKAAIPWWWLLSTSFCTHRECLPGPVSRCAARPGGATTPGGRPRWASAGLDVANLIFHLIRRYLVEDERETLGNLIGRVANRHDNAVV